MTAVRMTGVFKSYGTNDVLADLDLEIEKGEVFGLLGPNGAGKTTAVEILEGYRRADGGSVAVLGVDPSTAGSDFRARIGIVLQQTTSFAKSTVSETVSMFGAMFPNSMSTHDAIELVGLGPQADQVADTMSGGQRRRLDVACGLVGRPELLFLDEPTTGLDPEARRSMWGIIDRLRDEGTTVLLTTHYLDEAEALSDRIAILIGGRLRAVGDPSTVGGRDGAVATVSFVPDDSSSLDGWTRDGDRAHVETDEPTVLIASLAQQHGELRGLTVSRPTLEDVYLEMVGDHAEVES